MKKTSILLLALTLLLSLSTGCGQNGSSKSGENINLVSREDGSGTRGAFIELTGVLEKDENGNENDRTCEEAIIQNGTDGVMTTISGDKNGIGYISLGSLNDTVKALKIDDVEASSENLQKQSYKILRPFNISYKEKSNPLLTDFIKYILSEEGQRIVAGEGYVEANTDLEKYEKSSQKGNILIAGSTSIIPLMEKIAEKYEKLYPQVSVEIQSTGSSAGIQSVIEGSSDMGMASRQLKESEKKLSYEVIAIDGIALIVNKENPQESISLDELKSIYTGEISDWNNLE